jgi:hypothetical protein
MVSGLLCAVKNRTRSSTRALVRSMFFLKRTLKNCSFARFLRHAKKKNARMYPNMLRFLFLVALELEQIA